MQELVDDLSDILEDDYLKLTGEFPMVGDLTINSNDPRILLDDTLGTGTSSVEFKLNGVHLGQVAISVASGLTVTRFDSGENVATQLRLEDDQFIFTGGAVSFDSSVSTSVVPTNDAHLTNKAYVDSREATVSSMLFCILSEIACWVTAWSGV